MISSDGFNWELKENPIGTYMSLTYGNNHFVAVGYHNKIMYSDDRGVTWSLASSIPIENTKNQHWKTIVYGNGKFIALSTCCGHKIIFSNDGGINWSIAA